MSILHTHIHTESFSCIYAMHRQRLNVTRSGGRISCSLQSRRGGCIYFPLKDLCSFIQELCCRWATSSSLLQCCTNLLHDKKEKGVRMISTENTQKEQTDKSSNWIKDETVHYDKELLTEVILAVEESRVQGRHHWSTVCCTSSLVRKF